MDATTVGVIDSGNVGKALARGFASRRHDVMIGSRTPDKPELREWLEGEGEGIRAGSFDDVARHGQIAVLATLGAAVDEAIAKAGPESGKRPGGEGDRDRGARELRLADDLGHRRHRRRAPASSRSASSGSPSACAAAPSITPSSC